MGVPDSTSSSFSLSNMPMYSIGKKQETFSSSEFINGKKDILSKLAKTENRQLLSYELDREIQNWLWELAQFDINRNNCEDLLHELFIYANEMQNPRLFHAVFIYILRTCPLNEETGSRELGEIDKRVLQKWGIYLEEMHLSEKRISEKNLFDEPLCLSHQSLEEVISYCPYLKKLTLHSFNISEGTSFQISQLTQLKSLNLRKSFISDEVFDRLAERLKQIEELDLSGLRFTKTKATAIGNYLTNLRSLNLAGCEIIPEFDCLGVTDQILSDILPHLKLLEYLNLTGSPITDQSAKTFIENLPNLKSLDLTGCKTISQEGFIAIAQELKLEEFCLDYNRSGVTDEVALAISTHLTALKVLSLYDCSRISDVSLIHLAEKLKALESLNLGGIKEITKKVTDAILENLKELKFLTLDKKGRWEEGNLRSNMKQVGITVNFHSPTYPHFK